MRPSPQRSLARAVPVAAVLLRRVAMAAPVWLGLALASPARADVLDLQLQKLVPPAAMGQSPDPSAMSAQMDYRQLMSELSVALAPKILTPADTIGYNGFQFTADVSVTTISNGDCNQDAKTGCPWKGVAGNNATNSQGVPGAVTTISVYARKGIWFPLPSFELGAGATRLLQSDIFAVQVYGKLALHEGYHHWPIPSLAIRGSGLRVLGTNQVDLTMAQLDVTVSKSIGLFGSATLTPYMGGAVLFAIARGQVIDTTPGIDAYRQGPQSTDLNANVVFPDQDTIVRWRAFAGFRVVYSYLVLTADAMITACGDFDGSGCSHKDVLANNKIPDRAKQQGTFSASAGLLF